MKIQLPFAFKWKIRFFVSCTFVHASLWAELATQITQDRETGVCCEGFMGSAEEIILPLPLHTICWVLEIFFPYSHWSENYSRTCLCKKKTEKCQLSSQREKMPPKMAFWCHDGNKFHQGLSVNTRITATMLEPTVCTYSSHARGWKVCQAFTQHMDRASGCSAIADPNLQSLAVTDTAPKRAR